MKIFSLLLALVPVAALASPAPGTIMISGSCTIERASGTKTVPMLMNYGSRLHRLGYVGDDGGNYEIQIANNGDTDFEATKGALLIGFARADAVVQNPPELCPTSPDDLRKACEERNLVNNPPFVPAPTDRFSREKNVTGDVHYEVLGTNPDNFPTTEVVIPASQIVDETPVDIKTPVAMLGGVKASCSLTATRN